MAAISFCIGGVFFFRGTDAVCGVPQKGKKGEGKRGRERGEGEAILLADWPWFVYGGCFAREMGRVRTLSYIKVVSYSNVCLAHVPTKVLKELEAASVFRLNGYNWSSEQVWLRKHDLMAVVGDMSCKQVSSLCLPSKLSLVFLHKHHWASAMVTT